jgi:hypothetical protein
MERTPLREEFFRLAQEDPYTYQLQRMWAEAWVLGYETALADVVVGGDVSKVIHAKSRYERHDDAIEYLTGDRQRAEDLVALAVLGTKMERLASEHLARLMDPKRIEMHG